MENEISLLLVQINGRDAIPVRAIPYVTGWKLSPDEIAQQLARRAGDHFSSLKHVCAYHLQAGFPVKILPKEWDAYTVNFAGFDADIRAKYPNESQGYAAWRREATGLLPAMAFVWRDEFEKDFYYGFSPDKVIFSDERLGDRDLIYSPLLADDVRTMVLSGFNPRAAFAADPASAVPSDSVLPILPAAAAPDGLTGSSPDAALPVLIQSKSVKGITKEQVLIAFEGLVRPFNLKKALGNGKGLFGDNQSRTQKGTPGAKHAALWNPVTLAVGLNEKYMVPLSHLKKAFFEHKFLDKWSDEWRDALDYLQL